MSHDDREDQTRIADALEGILAELKKGYVVVPKGYSVFANNADWRPAVERIADVMEREAKWKHVPALERIDAADETQLTPCPVCGVNLVKHVVDAGGFCGSCGWEKSDDGS